MPSGAGLGAKWELDEDGAWMRVEGETAVDIGGLYSDEACNLGETIAQAVLCCAICKVASDKASWSNSASLI